ncbi:MULTISPECIES: DUF7511 domain-containing protein [Haloferax]|uniref:DUF7511 domain-containing protein n=6 Tax=Haloferax TaxID=2251 RepID=D4GTK6_HALVD|nr:MULTISPECIES: hypothetical protein [Haloferax]AAL74410.1 unknown [Haloferax volcanii]ADE04094.1 uncharacterized protein HVO_1977 [Haloferax volcanii DS2]ELK54834.1 hypothetical protein D320_07946 [Haloferax sp. BAB-2207]ELY34737.1 hypothetical protein C498_05156 [Haloferax volcanii DS2]ELZ56523.1 hypothetical protein C460_13950 [Haloferax sp. ATCC BAA-646]
MDDTTLRHDDPDATTTRPDALRRSDAADDELVAIVAPYDDAPDECTIFPAGLTEDELLTTWLSAQEGAYVALAEMR